MDVKEQEISADGATTGDQQADNAKQAEAPEGEDAYQAEAEQMAVPDELANLTANVIDKICALDNFKMYREFLPDKVADMTLKHFGDCEAVTDPSKRSDVLLLMRGAVVIIPEEKAYKAALQAVRRARRKRERLAEKRRQMIEKGLDPDEEANKKDEDKRDEHEQPSEESPIKKSDQEAKAALEEKFAREYIQSNESEFPLDRQIIAPDEFKLLHAVGSSFGNDKVVTTKNFRPAYAVSVAPDTVVVSIPARILEDLVRKLQNSGENRDKILFMKHFQWFENFTQSNQAKFNQCITKVEFFPGSKIICEGVHSPYIYIVISGTCNLICRRSTELFLHLEYQDPSKRANDADYNYLEQKRRGNNQERAFSDLGTKSSASLRALTSNGYVSKTLKTVQLGMKSSFEWIGEDMLAEENPGESASIYTAQAVTRMSCYRIPWQDVVKIVPAKSRDQMIQIVKTRRKFLEERTLQLYKNLKNIQKNLETGELFSVSEAGKGNDIFKMQKATVSNKVQKIGTKVREMVLTDTHGEPTEKELKALRIQRSNLKQDREVMRSVLTHDGLGSPVRRQVLEIEKQLPGIRVIETERVEETLSLPIITPNPKDRSLQSKLHYKSHAGLPGILNEERPSVPMIKETLTLTSQDLANYGRGLLLQSSLSASPTRRNFLPVNSYTPAKVNPSESYNGQVLISDVRSGYNMSGDPSVQSTYRMKVQMQPQLTGGHGSLHGAQGTKSMKNLQTNYKTPTPDLPDDGVIMGSYSGATRSHMQTTAQEAYGLQANAKGASMALSAAGKHPLDFSARSNSVFGPTGLQRTVSEAAIQKSRNKRNIYSHNQLINKQAQDNQFRTHNLADEVLNKPKEKRAYLGNARSLKPFVDPNLMGDDVQSQSSPVSGKKLRPKFYSKEYAKLRSVLPTIYNQNLSLEVQGKNAESTKDSIFIEKSLIYRQVQAMSKASEYEKTRQKILLQRRQEIIDERDKQKRLSQAKAKQYEQRLKQVEREVNEMQNPHIEGAMRALKLQVSDFSAEDKKRADELLKREQFKVHIAQDARDKFKAINMFENKTGASALKDTPAPTNGIAVSVPVFEEPEPDEDSADENSLERDDGKREFNSRKPSGRIAIIGISPQKGIKKINLNHEIQDEQLNQAILDPELITKLLAKGSSSVSPIRSRHGSLNGGNNNAQRGFVHAFDRVKQMTEQRKVDDMANLGRYYNNTAQLEEKMFKEFRFANSNDPDRVGGVADHRRTQEQRPETPNRWYQHQKKKLLLRYQKHLLEQDLSARELNLRLESMNRAKEKERRVKVMEAKKLEQSAKAEKEEEASQSVIVEEPPSEAREKEN